MLARLLCPGPALLAAQRPFRAPGAVSRDAVEPRATQLRRLVRGPHRLSGGRRRDAPAAARGLDSQPRPADRGLVPDQGSGHRLALGRALVHGAAGRRRRGQQQRELAVDRVGRRRPAAAGAPDLQPVSSAGALRPRRHLRPPLRARARARPRRVPGRAVDDARRGPGGLRLRHRQRLSGTDRRPRAGAARGARALRRSPL